MKPYNLENKTKSEEVRDMFDNIAPTYDRLNHILSFNIDKMWRRNVLRIARRHSPSAILDVATGTGDLAIALSKGIAGATIVGVDPSEGMLKVAQQKINKESLGDRITLQCGSAESLEAEDGTFDIATVAFGARNFGDLKKGISEMSRVLRPGGKLIVLEFSTCDNPVVAPLYQLYSHTLMPFIGGLLSKDKSAYNYLPESIEEFASPEEFIPLMEECGLCRCTNRPQCFGVAQIYIGEKI